MKERTIDDYIYTSLIITCIIIVFLSIIHRVFFNYITIPPCFFFEHFGIYCPGCGCTRAFNSLLNFNIFESIYFNPSVFYFAFMSIFYIIVQTIDRILKREYTFPYSNKYIYIGICILLLNFIVRNILLIIFHISI